MLPSASHRLYIPMFFSLDDIWPLYSWTPPLLHSAFRTGFFSTIFSTTFGLSTLKILDAAAACRETHLSFSVPSTELSAARQSKARAGKEPVSLPNTIVANTKTHRDFKYNCCKYKDTFRFQKELLQIQRHTEIPNTNAANAKKHIIYKYNCCKDTTKTTHNQ